VNNIPLPPLQVLGTIRHISLRALPEMSAQALAWADLSSFTSFVALDCLLPGPQEWHAFIKLFARTIALPILLLAASALMWALCWLFRHWAVRLHRKYGHRQAALRLRWQPLRSMQRRVASAPDPILEYLNPRVSARPFTWRTSSCQAALILSVCVIPAC
jgi:hypothetical protein